MIKALQQGITDPNSFKSTNICVKSGNTRLVVVVLRIDGQRNRWANIVCHLYICNCWSLLNEQSELSFATCGICLYVCLPLSLINDKHTIVWKCIGRYLSFGREREYIQYLYRIYWYDFWWACSNGSNSVLLLVKQNIGITGESYSISNADESVELLKWDWDDGIPDIQYKLYIQHSNVRMKSIKKIIFYITLQKTDSALTELKILSTQCTRASESQQVPLYYLRFIICLDDGKGLTAYDHHKPLVPNCHRSFGLLFQ